MTDLGVQYACEEPTRRIAVRDSPTLNGIDYLEVLDDDAPPGSPKQRTLLVHCFKPVPALGADNVRIEGGVRVTAIGVEWAFPAPAVPAALATPGELVFLAALVDADRVLVVRTDASGDFSTYRLSIVGGQSSPALTAAFDPQLSSAAFSFKVDCESEFDCRSIDTCRTPVVEGPQIDYVAKDFASFRRLMLDRMALLVPEWVERNPADITVALVELLAYAGDQLSYFQDAVATDAYLGTARQRISVRRHARLLDYPMHDGANARAWVHVTVETDAIVLGAGTPLLTTTNTSRGALDPSRLEAALSESALVFETVHDVTLWQAHNEIPFHTWADERCCLPAGATRATLVDRGHALAHLGPGDVLVFEERRDPDTGRTVDADPGHRHAVRLTEVAFREDPAAVEDPSGPQALRVADVAWDALDALPFPLCLWDVADEHGVRQPVSVAVGNVVLADHGRTVGEDLAVVPDQGRYRPVLSRGPVTQEGRVEDAAGELVAIDPGAPAAAAVRLDVALVQPGVRVTDPASPGVVWEPRRDLLGSDRFATELVVEVDDVGRAHLRFGDGRFGRLPPPGARLRAEYRVGNGVAGNVGAGAIAHAVTTELGIVDVRNPLPAAGGLEPERSQEVRLFAPQAFRRQERAVTEDDYAAVAQRHPEVQRAAATRRWTGSWYTVFLTVDRADGRPVDGPFRDGLKAFMDRFRLAGYDLEIDAPRFVPLDIVLTVCTAPDHFRSAVKAALLTAFGTGTRPDGSRGFFHPDNLTFRQPVYLSQVVATATAVPGVESVDFDPTPPKPNRFQRWGELPRGEIAAGVIELGRLEIARLDNDPNRPENGRLDLVMKGGL